MIVIDRRRPCRRSQLHSCRYNLYLPSVSLVQRNWASLWRMSLFLKLTLNQKINITFISEPRLKLRTWHVQHMFSLDNADFIGLFSVWFIQIFYIFWPPSMSWITAIKPYEKSVTILLIRRENVSSFRDFSVRFSQNDIHLNIFFFSNFSKNFLYLSP